MRCVIPIVIVLLTQLNLAAAPAVTNSDPAETIRAELTRQIPECETISENAARLLLQNPPHKDLILTEWQKFCGASKEYFLYTIAQRLPEIGPTSPEINASLWETLKTWSKSKTGMRRHPQLSALFRANGEAAKPTSEEGKLLKIWFATGYTPFLRAVAQAEKSRFYPFFENDRTYAQRGLSLALALQGTYWIPNGNLARLGNHPGIGMQMHMGYGNFFFGLLMDFRFGLTPAPYSFFNENTGALEQNSQFFGLFVGPDVKWAFLNFEQLSILAVAGFGYDLISHYSVPRYSRLRPAYSDSFNINGGLAARYYFSADRGFYAETEFRVHRAGFGSAGQGGDDLSGYYYTAVLTLGYKINFNEF